MFLVEFFQKYIKIVVNIPIIIGYLFVLVGTYEMIKSLFKKMIFDRNQEIESIEMMGAGIIVIIISNFFKILIYKLFRIGTESFKIIEMAKGIFEIIPVWIILLLVFGIIAIFSLIGAIRENMEEKEYEKRKIEKRIAEQTDINKYIKKLRTFDFGDENIKSKIKELIGNLEKLKNKDKENNNKNGGEFAGRYLPILIETLSGAEKVRLTNKEINNIVVTIATINVAIDKIIEQSEEPTLEDINATTTALTQVLKLKFKEQDDFVDRN